MANRLFITLLALLTGLAAQVGPAQARACASSAAEIGAMTSVASERRQSAPEALLSLPATPRSRLADESESLSAPGDCRIVSAVLTGIDRARE